MAMATVLQEGSTGPESNIQEPTEESVCGRHFLPPKHP